MLISDVVQNYEKYDKKIWSWSFTLLNAYITFMRMFFKITEIDFQSLTNVNIILNCKNDIREGITKCCCSEANNKYMHDYD